MSQPIPIVMLTTGRWQFTRLAIHELASCTLSPYRLIVVDLGSTDGTREVLAEAVADGLVWATVLVGHALELQSAQGWDLGAALVGGQVYVQTTDEWLPPREQDWLERLMAASQRNPSICLALQPNFFPRGLPRRGREARGVWLTDQTEPSFRCVPANLPECTQGYLTLLEARYVLAEALRL